MTGEHESWRYRCPEGHTQWQSRESGYYCIQCDEEFAVLRDMKAEPLRY